MDATLDKTGQTYFLINVISSHTAWSRCRHCYRTQYGSDIKIVHQFRTATTNLNIVQILHSNPTVQFAFPYRMILVSIVRHIRAKALQKRIRHAGEEPRARRLQPVNESSNFNPHFIPSCAWYVTYRNMCISPLIFRPLHINDLPMPAFIGAYTANTA